MPTYYIVPVINGEADIDWSSDSFRVMHYCDVTINEMGDVKQIMYGELNSGTPRDSWEEITEEQFYEVVPREDENNHQVDKFEEIRDQLTQQDIIQAEQLSLQADILLNQQIIQENQAMMLSNQADILLGGVTENV